MVHSSASVKYRHNKPVNLTPSPLSAARARFAVFASEAVGCESRRVNMRSRTAVVVLAALAGCSNQYSELADRFPKQGDVTTTELPQNTVSIFDTNSKGIFTLRNAARIGLGEEFVTVEGTGAFSVAYEPIQIPVSQISGCSLSSFGEFGWEVNLTLGTAGFQLGISDSCEALQWCDQRGLPLIGKNDGLAWRYRREPLPSREDLLAKNPSYKLPKRCSS